MKTKKTVSRKTKRPFVEALNFFAEAGLLKRVKRSGWWVAGIENPETVAEHSFRTAVIGFYLAFVEEVDPFRVVSMCLFNDIHEARINDLHKMGHYYIDFKAAEKQVFQDQMKNLDERVQRAMTKIRDEYDTQATKESLVARDADILECLIQAKEYYDHGYQGAKLFFNRAPRLLKTKGAQQVWREVKKWESSLWWRDVVKFER